ncbi:MAG: alpha/beta fold hydrolase [Phycisphaerae bacterium]|nr:alpha/beta fold hydrolase [Phycisphaerae bacterium]
MIPKAPGPASLPSALARQTRFLRLGASGVPALLAHPDWTSPRPFAVWMHGRTVSKELDNGRYLRWLRAEGGGIAACAIDLPGHGERYDPLMHHPSRTLDVIARVVDEIDGVLDALQAEFGGLFDPDRAALGGMSAGGMATLARLNHPHRFRCAAVEATAGNMGMLFQIDPARSGSDAALLHAIDPIRHTAGFRPIPLLALHSRGDRGAPGACLETYLDVLRARYRAVEADPALIHLQTWDTTGAPDEHNGFGRVAAEAKSIQTAFLERHLTGQGG